MKIAFCSDIRQFHQDRLRYRDWSQKFLGSAWITSLYERAPELGIELASGDVALQRIQTGHWRAEEVFVVQEMYARHGLELCRLGAIPAVLMMLESPLVAYRSVDRLAKLQVQFAHCIGPHPVFEHIPALRHSRYWPLTFPSYWRNQVPPPQPWKFRKHAVLVAANKYWRERSWARIHSLRDALRVVRHGLRKRLSSTYQACWRLQLHDERIELLHVLGQRNQIDIYGRGWSDTSNMPPLQAEKMNSINKAFRGECGNKHELLGQYKFTIAFENTAYPGYVTEKIIDAIVSSSIPVYHGAPDITDQLPAAAFIDARDFASPEAIATRMEKITEIEAATIQRAGLEFLNSKCGQHYSYEGFANWIVELLGGKIQSA